jgi:nitrite reductase/ring-hydroxylating ferredoxin subunit
VADYVKVGKTTDFPLGQGKIVAVNGKTIAIFNVGGSFYALDNTCLHRGGPLGDGELEGTSVTCPWHGWRYDLATGETTFNPAAKVDTYAVKLDDGEVSVMV